ncbi:hypothetical protein ACFL5G_00090 [Candidatus Margulisiibacteriota bacterium]
MAKYAEVLINRSKIYTYQIPPELESSLQVGSEVEVPLRNKRTTGYLLSLVGIPEFPTKDIYNIKRPERVFDEALVDLAKWMSEYYRCYYTTALKTILPKEK